MTTTQTTKVQLALSVLLTSLGFETLARDVLTETDPDTLGMYIRGLQRQVARRRPDLTARLDLILRSAEALDATNA